MKDLIKHARIVRAFVDWMNVAGQVREEGFLYKEVVEPLLSEIDDLPSTYARSAMVLSAHIRKAARPGPFWNYSSSARRTLS